MVWDPAEGVPIGESSGSFGIMVDRYVHVLKQLGDNWGAGQCERASATHHPLPDNSSQLLATDPPYYYSVQYAGLSDFFYVWLKRSLDGLHGDLLRFRSTPKDEEIVVASPTQAFASTGRNVQFYERELTSALREARRVVTPSGCGFIVFAQLQTSAWEAFLSSVVEAGWIITGSWPIDTEMASRIIAAQTKRSWLIGSHHRPPARIQTAL